MMYTRTVFWLPVRCLVFRKFKLLPPQKRVKGKPYSMLTLRIYKEILKGIRKKENPLRKKMGERLEWALCKKISEWTICLTIIRKKQMKAIVHWYSPELLKL